jgi:hypothetical protein
MGKPGKDASTLWLRHIVPAAVLLGVATAAQESRADTTTYLSPSIAVGGLYNDNIFLTSSDSGVERRGDEILRISPALEGGYGSETLTVGGYYTFDAERYDHDPGLDGNTVRRNAAFDFNYLATPRLDLAMQADYTSTQTPSELDVTTLAVGRAHAVYMTVAPSMGYAFDELSFGRIGYTHGLEELGSNPDTSTDTGNLGFEHRFTPRDDFDFNFYATRYDFGPNDVVDSRVVTVGWTHQFTPLTSVSVAAGPRRTESDNSVDYSAGLHTTLNSGTFDFDYNHTETALIGEFRPAESQSVVAKLDYFAGNDLEFYVVPSASRDTIGTAVATLYRLDASFNYRLSRVTSLVGSYEYSRQNGLLTGATSQIMNNVIYIGLMFSTPAPGESAFSQRRANPFENQWPAPRTQQISPYPTNYSNTPSSPTTTDQTNETPPP